MYEKINCLWARNEINRPLGVRQPVSRGWKVMLPTMHNLLMAIYSNILSSQQKCHSMSVSVCQVGLKRRRTSSPTHQAAETAVHSQMCMFITYLGGSSMMLQWVLLLLLPWCVFVCVYVRVHVCIPLSLFVHSLC